MNELVQLNSTQHQNLKLKPQAFLDVAEQLQIVNINASEVAKMALHAPIFILKNSQNGAWGLSALTGLQAGSNILMEQGQWLPSFVPLSLQSYPFVLQQPEQESQQSTIAFNNDSSALSDQLGEPLFNETGEATTLLNNTMTTLKQNLDGQVVSHHFVKALEPLNLLKMIDLNLYYADGSVEPLKGFYTINEAVLQGLSAEQLKALHDKGYLMVVHAMLLSLQQLNELIKQHNKRDSNKSISKLSIEVNRSSSVSGLS